MGYDLFVNMPFQVFVLRYQNKRSSICYSNLYGFKRMLYPICLKESHGKPSKRVTFGCSLSTFKQALVVCYIQQVNFDEMKLITHRISRSLNCSPQWTVGF
jgi:hypothetical protein